MMDIEVQGKCPARFQPVADAFAYNFSQELELGASFSVCMRGETLVNIYGGYTDKKREQLWRPDTLTCIFSSGKAVMAYLVAKAVSDGLLDYDAPIVTFWPEFGAHGKAEITLAQALSHQSGLPGIDTEMDPSTWIDWEALCARIAAMKPMWELGTGSGYHPQTFGFIVGEVYRRATGKTIGASLRALNLDLYCGLPEAEHTRVAYMPKPPKAPDLGDINEYTKVAFLKPWSSSAKVSRQEWMAAEIPASNMHGNAAALASIMHPVANSGHTLSGEETISTKVLSDLYKEQCFGKDLVLPFTLSWAAGMMRNVNGHFGPNKKALGQSGFGGSVVVMDPEHHISMAYVMNKMSPHLVGDPRALRLIDAVYACL